ncbi:MAG TPA: TIGR02281 family clan AA aspartic protease [Methylophilaceae bacterium]|nr:TIGR02281 family clan AA aspartic protease [Methylophilaceae bacterium]
MMRWVVGLVVLVISMHVLADTQINIVGLFNNKALVMINGSGPYHLQAGQTKSGVKLISANSDVATLEVEGMKRVLRMGQAAFVAASTSSTEAVNRPVSLYADQAGHFFGNLTLNGGSFKYVIDTGATNVTLNSNDAEAAKIDFRKGTRVNMATANGVVPAFKITLNTLKIGTIILNNIDATVIEGSSPPFILLGMSAQNRLNIKRENSIMTLTKKY